MSQTATLRARAEALASRLPPLLAEAEHLASTVLLGEHGRRRTGIGDTFWQYRPAQPTDSARRIDWRRSARTDAHFVQQKEWQIAQSVGLWVDRAASMTFGSGETSKGDRARLLALALAALLLRGGERVGLTGGETPPRSGRGQLARIGQALAGDDGSDFGAPEVRGMQPSSRAVFFSDFLGDPEPVEAALTRAADRHVKGVLVQVLDPQEEAFPFDGRTVFESMAGGIVHETLKASELRERYLARLAARKERLRQVTRRTGWQYLMHRTDQPATGALLALYGVIGRAH